MLSFGCEKNHYTVWQDFATVYKIAPLPGAILISTYLCVVLFIGISSMASSGFTIQYLFHVGMTVFIAIISKGYDRAEGCEVQRTVDLLHLLPADLQVPEGLLSTALSWWRKRRVAQKNAADSVQKLRRLSLSHRVEEAHANAQFASDKTDGGAELSTTGVANDKGHPSTETLSTCEEVIALKSEVESLKSILQQTTLNCEEAMRRMQQMLSSFPTDASSPQIGNATIDGPDMLPTLDTVKQERSMDTIQYVFTQHSNGELMVNSSKLSDICHDLGIHCSQQKQQKLLARLDPDNHGVVGFDEFHHWLIERDRKKRVRVQGDMGKLNA